MPDGDATGDGGGLTELVAAAAVFASVATGTFLAEGQDWALHVVFFDTGQADAVALVASDGSAAVVDAGNSMADGERVAAFLGDANRNGVAPIDRVELAFATHYDADHIRGFPGLVNAGTRFDTVFDQGVSTKREGSGPSSPYARYERYLFGEDAVTPAARRTPAVGDRWRLGDAEIRLLAIAGDTYGTAEDVDLDPSTRPASREFDENCGSLALLVRLGQFELYLAGDQTSNDWRGFADTEMAVAGSNALGAGNRDVDVLKANHHGSDSSNGPRFLHVLDPEVAVITSEHTHHHLPKASTVQELVRNGTAVFVTGDGLDQDGRFPDSNHTDRDDGFEAPLGEGVYNDVGDVHLYVARDGERYQVQAGDSVWTFSSVDADNPHAFSYPDSLYPSGHELSLDEDGLPECR